MYLAGRGRCQLQIYRYHVSTRRFLNAFNGGWDTCTSRKVENCPRSIEDTLRREIDRVRFELWGLKDFHEGNVEPFMKALVETEPWSRQRYEIGNG